MITRIFIAWSLAVCVRAEVHLSGRVTGAGGAAVAGAHVVLHDPVAKEAVSDAAGGFAFVAGEPGIHRISVEHRDYFPTRERKITLLEGRNEITLELNAKDPVLQSVEVRAQSIEALPPAVLSGEQILAVPYPADYNLRNAVRILPGIVQDRRGRIHVDGGADDQVHYTLDGFTVNDPITGRFDGQVSVDSVRTMELYSGRFTAEYGKGSAGTLAIKTHTGDDQFHSSATNFIPAFESRKGLTLGSWLPRVSFSGPIARGRAWFSSSNDAQYEQAVIKEISQGLDRTHVWRLSNVLHVQANLTPSNILHAGVMASRWDAPHQGLTFLDPAETTVDRRARQRFFHFKDQIYFGQGALVEFGYAGNRTSLREAPQAEGVYVQTPEGRRGNHFVNAAREGSRDQFVANLFLPSFAWLGTHQVKAGVDFDRLIYGQQVSRTAVEYRNLEGVVLRRVVYAGLGDAGRRNHEASGYLQDTWRLRPNLTLEVGMRQDWDRLVDRPSVSPRLGVAWAPTARATTKLAAGFAVVNDATSLRLFARPFDQYSLASYYDAAGALIRGPAATVYTLGPRALRPPRYRSWTLGAERVLPGRLQAGVHYLHKKTANGFTYRNLTAVPALQEWLDAYQVSTFDGILGLANDRRDQYDAVQVKLRKSVRQYEWSASYTRSRALTNAVVDVNVDDPILITENAGPMPWDAPHRVVSSALLPTPWRHWEAAYMVEYRSGLPFSVQDAEGRLRGAVNSYRFPPLFECNLHLQRTFELGGRRWAVRFGVNNLTGHRNPTVVDNNMGSARFLSFYGSPGRAFNVRLRWLGPK
ncbi:MAG: TonB-dependent receptor [Candidatus Solibacter usitatus]|nr:TonB-dependent receptor [Candidatus Solibacter usitatus]